jgi:hypothetical protein
MAMPLRTALFLIPVLMATTASSHSSQNDPLTFEQRVEAQRSLERVRYGHLAGASRRFEEAVTQATLERKVEVYLAQSASLERQGIEITSEMLQAELARIQSQTLMPERLREMIEALQDDPFLVLECLVRPVLVGRLFNPSAEEERPLSETASAGCGTPWQTQSLPAGAGRAGHTAVWTGSEILVWGGYSGSTPLTSGYRYDPALATHTPISTAGAPGPGAAAVWTGSEMIVSRYYTGGRYDPLTDSWTPIPDWKPGVTPIGTTAVWDGTGMIVWGGTGTYSCLYNGQIRTCTYYMNDGARYNPSTNAWTSVPAGAFPRAFHSAVWTGSRMVIWGGEECLGFPGNCPGAVFPLNDGAAYDPVTNTWQPIAGPTGVSGRTGHVALWTGSRMLIWGGSAYYFNPVYTQDGALYDPATDTWSSMASPSALSPRREASAVWTGSEALIWGGKAGSNGFTRFSDGEVYLLGSNSWTAFPQSTVPVARSGTPAIWTGSQMVLWSGDGANGPVTTVDRWTPPPAVDADGDGVRLCLGDCDDTRNTVRPGAAQVCGDGLNNDCLSPSWPSLAGTNDGDDDGDGVTECAGDCNDARATVYPGAPQICDQLNNDCLAPNWPSTAGTNDQDADQDHWRLCQGDCDDARAAVYPGAPQICDGLNNDCNAPGWPAVTGSHEGDDDGDGFTECAGDCDDAHGSVYPGGMEICGDGFNNDCLSASWPAIPDDDDFDQDSWSSCQGDCDDQRGNIRPGAPQVCDGYNNDCNDPAWPALTGNETDADLDQFTGCAGDCDDTRAAVRPGGPQICGDGLNNDCNDPAWPALAGTNEVDGDGDGLSECALDCNDAAAEFWSVPAEIPDLLVSASGSITWQAPTPPGSVAVQYDVIRILDDLRQVVYAGTCVGPNLSQQSFTDTDTPYPGYVYSYLIRAKNGCGAGPASSSPNLEAIAAATCP